MKDPSTTFELLAWGRTGKQKVAWLPREPGRGSESSKFWERVGCPAVPACPAGLPSM